MSDEAPNGCPGCNPEGSATMLAMLTDRGMTAVEVPRPRHAWSDIVPCEACGRAWLVQKIALMAEEIGK